MRVSPSVATSGAGGKDSNHPTKKRDGKVSGRKLVEKMFLKSAFAQFSSLKVLSRLAVSHPVQTVMAAGEDGGLLMTSFVTQLLTFCAEALKESTAIHDPINHMFVELPEIERTMAVLHSKFAQNYYSAAGDCVPRATVSDASRHAARKSGSPTRKTGAAAIYERAAAAAPQPTPRSSFLRYSHSQIFRYDFCYKKKYCFVIRSVLASSNMPTSEQLAIATAEALGAVDSATESGKVFNALSQINVLKPPAYLVKLLNSHFFVN